jgi:D-alanine-D-alanine ligase
MIQSLVRAGFEVTPIAIGRDGTWSLLTTKDVDEGFPAEIEGAHPKAAIFGSALAITMDMIQQGIQVVVIGLHGPGGEDGTLQGFFETVGLAYTGPGVAASAVAVDKVLLKLILRGSGLPTAAWIDLGRPEDDAAIAKASDRAREWAAAAGYPLVVKARALGSSVGVAFAPDEAALVAAIGKIASERAGVFVEKAVAGIEVSCGVVGRGAQARALPAIEILPKKGAWFDFDSKYAPGGALERVPAQVDAATEERIRALALEVHAVIGADGVTRTDMIIGDRGPVILETNTLPGMTETSLVPQEAQAIGWSLETLLTMLVEAAWTRRHGSLAANGGEAAP